MRAPYSSKEHCKEQAIKEQLEDLDFKESFIEKLLKNYPAKKIEKKLDLLLIKKNIQSPAGWLRAALKNDYQDEEPSMSSPISPLSFPRRRESSECHDESRIDSRFRGNDIKNCGNDKKDDGNLKCRGTMHRALNESEQIDLSSTENTNTPKWTSREKALEAIKLIQDNLSLPVYPRTPQGKGP